MADTAAEVVYKLLLAIEVQFGDKVRALNKAEKEEKAKKNGKKS